MDSKSTVQMFWHGEPLSRMEALSMASFLKNGHAVDLYVYEEPASVPAGVRLMDAHQILSPDLIFRHRRTGSLAAFADWFRYQLLLERGGLWADTDVVCLQPFSFPDPVVFGWADQYVNNAVLSLPAGHDLAVWMTELCRKPNRWMPFDGFAMRARKLKRSLLFGDRRDRLRWAELGPKGLTAVARYLGYLRKARPEYDLYPVRCGEWHLLFETSERARSIRLEGSYCVHLWHNMARQRPGFDKNASFPTDSIFEQLCQRFLPA
jgi:hypothetical protein